MKDGFVILLHMPMQILHESMLSIVLEYSQDIETTE